MQKVVGLKVVPRKETFPVSGHMLGKRTAWSLTLKTEIYPRLLGRNSACYWFTVSSTLDCGATQMLPHKAGKMSCTYAMGTEQKTRCSRCCMRGD